MIYNEGDHADSFFIIKHGEIMLNKFFEEAVVNKFLANKFKKKFKVAVIGTGEIFGEIESLTNEKRHFQAVSTNS